VTVVIATRGNAGLAVEAVESILAGTVVPSELIVVDQSQWLDPRVAALPDLHSGVRVIHTHTVGLAAAQNQAIGAATSDLIVFTDDDVLVDRNWLEQMVAALVSGGQRVAITGRVLATEAETDAGRAISLATDPLPAVYEGRLHRDVLSGNSMGFHRSAFADCGLFDERLGTGTRFGSASDNDFGYRLLSAGYRIQYVPDAVLYHRARRSGRALTKVQWDYGRGQGAFLAKHARAGDSWMRNRLVSTVTWWLRRIAARPLRKRNIRGHGDLIYLAAFLSGAAEWSLRSSRRGAQFSLEQSRQS
jgi:GT2 family glycosyltransferase